MRAAHYMIEFVDWRLSFVTLLCGKFYTLLSSDKYYCPPKKGKKNHELLERPEFTKFTGIQFLSPMFLLNSFFLSSSKWESCFFSNILPFKLLRNFRDAHHPNPSDVQLIKPNKSIGFSEMRYGSSLFLFVELLQNLISWIKKSVSLPNQPLFA